MQMILSIPCRLFDDVNDNNDGGLSMNMKRNCPRDSVRCIVPRILKCFALRCLRTAFLRSDMYVTITNRNDA